MITLFTIRTPLHYLFCTFIIVLTIALIPTVVCATAIKNKPPLTILGTYKNISKVKRRSLAAVVVAQEKEIKRKVSSRSAIVIDSHSGKTLFARSPDKQRQPASTIKVLTGIIALKTLDQQEEIPVSRKAAHMPSSKIYLDQRRKYQVNDLINAVLLASANDASVALAEKIAGTEQSFAKMMTQHAHLWGASSTICKTATGLTAPGQKSTARDLATIFNEAMKDEEFAGRMKRTKARTQDGNLLRNHNKALWQLKGTLGGKTGYTNAARQTYVGKFQKGNDEIIVAILGSESMWGDLKRLVDYGFTQKQFQRELAEKQAESTATEMLAEEMLVDSTSSE